MEDTNMREYIWGLVFPSGRRKILDIYFCYVKIFTVSIQSNWKSYSILFSEKISTETWIVLLNSYHEKNVKD